MRPATLIPAVAALVAILVCLAPSASASTRIPNTNVQVVDLGPASITTTLGKVANFSWGIFNGGPQTYTLRVTAISSDPDFPVQVVPTAFSLPRDSLWEVYVNVTTPRSGDLRQATVAVTFETLSPVASSVMLNVTVVVRPQPGPLDALTVFLVVSGIIAIGFAATLVFERTRIPDILILIFLGLLLGPLALRYLGIALVPPGAIEAATPYFTALALMFILFDGGLNLRLGPVIQRLGLVGLHTGLTFILTMATVAFVATVVLGHPMMVGVLLGAILAGTSSAVVIGIVRALRVSEETKILLVLESVLTDVLCVVTALAIVEYLRGGPGASPWIVVGRLGGAFIVSLFYGSAFGIGWLILLKRLKDKPFSYMLTIAVLLTLYATSELSGGSGAMASFVFGLILGNHALVGRRLGFKTRFAVDDRIRLFHGEISFVIRTFFFVFLGLVVSIDISGRWGVGTSLPVLDVLNGTFFLLLLGTLLIFLGIVGVRIVTARIVSWMRPRPPGDRKVLWSLMGRGLAAAVLASIAFSIPAFTSPASPGDQYYHALLAPYQAQFLNIVFFIILLSVGATTLGVYSSQRALGRLPVPVPARPEVSTEILFESELDAFLSEPAPSQGTGEAQEPPESSPSSDSAPTPDPEEKSPEDD